MFSKFWEKLAEGIADKWTAQPLGPALVFWGGGLLAWAWRYGWKTFTDWLEGLDNTAAYLALIVGGLLLLTASSVVVERLQLAALRLAEGYWPRPFKGLRFALARCMGARLQKKEARWQALADIEPEARSAEQQAEYANLDAELAHYPVDPRRLMPFRLGNILRAAEEYPQVRYGLVTNACWPRLWLLLPKETQETLAEARGQLNSAARLCVWSVLFLVWTVWAWWAVPAGLAAAVVAYYWGMMGAAGVYGDLLRAAFDLHRFALYEALRWPLPPGPAKEVAYGEQLSEYLFRGTGGGGVQFAAPDRKEDTGAQDR
jgi:hypothetical protein